MNLITNRLRTYWKRHEYFRNEDVDYFSPWKLASNEYKKEDIKVDEKPNIRLKKEEFTLKNHLRWPIEKRP